MGAEQFSAFENEPDVKKAFANCVEQAKYDYGHSGYTGTIAEKSDFVIIKEFKDGITEEQAAKEAEDLMENDDPRIDDKWGPAGAIHIVDPVKNFDGWLFFGWASS